MLFALPPEATPARREIDDGKRHLGLFCVSPSRETKGREDYCAASIRLIELSPYTCILFDCDM